MGIRLPAISGDASGLHEHLPLRVPNSDAALEPSEINASSTRSISAGDETSPFRSEKPGFGADAVGAGVPGTISRRAQSKQAAQGGLPHRVASSPLGSRQDCQIRKIDSDYVVLAD
jgi:hypothetical protein